jgi:hypothetical protein
MMLFIRRRRHLVSGRRQEDNQGMIWNEVRDHIRERLPAIVDFVLFAAAMTMVATVLLGLTWLYIEYGMFVFWAGVGIIVICAILNERRRPVYFGDGGDPFVLGGDKPSLPPPGKRALPAPSTPRISRSNPAITSTQRRALPGSKRE